MICYIIRLRGRTDRKHIDVQNFSDVRPMMNFQLEIDNFSYITQFVYCKDCDKQGSNDRNEKKREKKSIERFSSIVSKIDVSRRVEAVGWIVLGLFGLYN